MHNLTETHTLSYIHAHAHTHTHTLTDTHVSDSIVCRVYVPGGGSGVLEELGGALGWELDGGVG